MVFGKLQPNPNRPDVLWFQRAFLTDDAASIPSRAMENTIL